MAKQQSKPAEEQAQDLSSLDIGKLAVGAPSDEAAENTEEKEEIREEGKPAEGAGDTSDEENKVSYSRFKNVHSRYREAERKAQELEARLEELESRKAERIEREVPKFEGRKWETWTKLYGDSEQSRTAYRDYMAEFAPPDESYIREVASRAYQEEARAESRRIETNERTIDDELEDLSVIVGRDLTDEEQVAVLDIMDKNSLADEDGRILKLYPAEQAWDIYEIESQAGKSSRQAARNRVAGLTGSSSSGEPTAHGRAQEDKTFDPRWEALDASMNRRR